MLENRFNGFPRSGSIRIRKRETVETVHGSRKAFVNANLKVGENENVAFSHGLGSVGSILTIRCLLSSGPDDRVTVLTSTPLAFYTSQVLACFIENG